MAVTGEHVRSKVLLLKTVAVNSRDPHRSCYGYSEDAGMDVFIFSFPHFCLALLSGLNTLTTAVLFRSTFYGEALMLAIHNLLHRGAAAAPVVSEINTIPAQLTHGHDFAPQTPHFSVRKSCDELALFPVYCVRGLVRCSWPLT